MNGTSNENGSYTYSLKLQTLAQKRRNSMVSESSIAPAVEQMSRRGLPHMKKTFTMVSVSVYSIQGSLGMLESVHIWCPFWKIMNESNMLP